MRKLFITLAITLFTIIGFAQEKKVSYSAYVPLKTYHWDREPVEQGYYAKHEGGNIGLIIIRQKQQTNKLYTTTSLGVTRNSFGDASVVVMGGAGTNIIGLSVGGSIGFATGYERFYSDNFKRASGMPGILKNNGILPYMAVDISLTKGLKISDKVDITPMVVISPAFANAGLRINL